MKWILPAAFFLALIAPARAEDKPAAGAEKNPEIVAERQAFKEELNADRKRYIDKRKEKVSAEREKIKGMRAKAREERKAKKAAAAAANAANGPAAETAPVPSK